MRSFASCIWLNGRCVNAASWATITGTGGSLSGDTTMRKQLLFVISSAMLVGGLYLLGAELFWARKWYGWMILGGAMLVALGAYLLWADFIAPALGIKTPEQ